MLIRMCYFLEKLVVKIVYLKIKFNYFKVIVIEVVIEEDFNMIVKNK